MDQWTGFSTGTDTYDGGHPNASGDQKMSDAWYPALTAALSGPSSPTPTSGSGDCAAAYRITGQWQGGFQGEVTVTYTGASPLTGWDVGWTFADGQAVSRLWGGRLTQTGSSVQVRNETWNGALASGATTTFGFLSSWTTTNTPPTATCARA
ncbi:cellulose binding domain-containing protein [Nonomuraea sp. NPDC047529]|uniref:cellulose binding domain-containing protein n=1 Tax=Nonomuraea sp. NPDC047529 TaxID=3155623 RepID=UPI0033E6AD80